MTAWWQITEHVKNTGWFLFFWWMIDDDRECQLPFSSNAFQFTFCVPELHSVWKVPAPFKVNCCMVYFMINLDMFRQQICWFMHVALLISITINQCFSNHTFSKKWLVHCKLYSNHYLQRDREIYTSRWLSPNCCWHIKSNIRLSNINRDNNN